MSTAELTFPGPEAPVPEAQSRAGYAAPAAIIVAVAAFLGVTAFLNSQGVTDYDLPITVAGLGVGFVVGLTGMGGGALMTPILVLLFGVQPLTAVSSDLVVSLIMKPVGGGVHLRRGTVRRDLVKWLVVASVPAAFCGVLLIKALGGPDTEHIVKRALGATLLVASAAMLLKVWLQRTRGEVASGEPFAIKVVPTLAVGLFGGLIVGMTSVGSGSLMIICLMFLYPRLSGSELVGTDLVQAIPLVGSAALGHLLFGAVEFGLTGALLVGALPGVYLGARLSASAPDRLIRPVLAAVLLISGWKLLTG